MRETEADRCPQKKASLMVTDSDPGPMPLSKDDIPQLITKAKKLGVTREQFLDALSGNKMLARLAAELWPAS
jgi:hypothetical protein